LNASRPLLLLTQEEIKSLKAQTARIPKQKREHTQEMYVALDPVAG
jgi:hypothetical protein